MTMNRTRLLVVAAVAFLVAGMVLARVTHRPGPPASAPVALLQPAPAAPSAAEARPEPGPMTAEPRLEAAAPPPAAVKTPQVSPAPFLKRVEPSTRGTRAARVRVKRQAIAARYAGFVR